MFEAKVYTTAILSLSGMMDDPQAADVVIGIVDNWDKDTAWVDDCIRQGKHVTLLYSAYQDPNNTIPCEHSEMEAFRESLHGRCRCLAYRNAAELKEKVTETLQAQMSASSH